MDQHSVNQKFTAFYFSNNTFGTYDYVYDDNGNMIEKRQGGALVRGITYDYRNRVTGLSDGVSFSYDNTDTRIIKQAGRK